MSLEEKLQEDEALLTKVKVKNNQYDDKQLQLRFHGLSDVYVPHLHTYASCPLTEDDQKALAEFLKHETIDGKENPFYEYRDSICFVNEYFNIVQIRAPRRLADDFRKLKLNSRQKQFQYDSQERGKTIFRGGFYDKQARWNIGYENDFLQPGLIYRIGEETKEILSFKRNLDTINSKLKKTLRDNIKKQKENVSLGRALSNLRKNFTTKPEEADKKCNASKFNVVYTQEVRDLIKELIRLEDEFKTKYSCYGNLVYNPDSNKRIYELYLDKRPSLSLVRGLSPEEWMGLDYLLLDIETPKFKENDGEITQVTCCHVSGKEVKNLKLYNKIKINVSEIKGHEVVSGFESDDDLIQAISDYSIEHGIDVIMAFNNNFDLRKLRERGDFLFGEGEEEPKYKVTKSFFERLDVNGGFCIDLLRIAQTFLRGFPNSKLEMFSRFLYGEEGYRKKITYDEMYELQLLSEKRKITPRDSVKTKIQEHSGKNLEQLTQEELSEHASEIILDYVAEDGTTMYDCFFGNDLVSKCMEDCCWISNFFQLNFTDVLQSPNSLREVWDRGYFKHIGLNRDRIYPKGIKWFEKQREKGKRALKKFVEDSLEIKTKQGVFSELERRYLPISIMLENYKYFSTERVANFLKHAKEISLNEDPNRTIFFARYTRGLLDYLFEDFGKWLFQRKEYSYIIKSLDDFLLPNIRRNPETLDNLANAVLKEITRQGYFGEGDISYTLNNLKKIRDESGFDKFIQENEAFFRSMSQKLWLTNNDLYNIFWNYFKLKKQQIRVKGSYRIMPKNIEAILLGKLSDEKETLELTRDIVHVDFPFLYSVRKENPASKEEQSLFIGKLNSGLPVQTTLEKAYVSGKKVYSKEHGFHKGIKLNKEEPGFRSNPFLSSILEQALDLFFQRKFQEGADVVLQGVEKIRSLKETTQTDEEKKQTLFWTKSRSWYRGFKDGKEYYFAPKELHEDKEVFKDKEGEFFLVDLRGKKTRINLHEVSDFSQDFSEFEEYYKKKMSEFLRGVKQELKVDWDNLSKINRNLKKSKKENPNQLQLF